MSLDQKGRSTSPVHIHVDEEIPVHVHVKKPKKPSSIGIDVSTIFNLLTLEIETCVK